MASPEEVKDSIESFAQACNENKRLGEMIRDWNRIIHIYATDLNLDLTLITNAGHVTEESKKPSTANLSIQATGELLTQIFYGEVSPNEPYNDGTLRVQGPESDLLRLDFITAMLWG
jgi:hypothetical protein